MQDTNFVENNNALGQCVSTLATQEIPRQQSEKKRRLRKAEFGMGVVKMGAFEESRDVQTSREGRQPR